ncbi:ShlB/FhaC/HecB family hemolysin secretion/activation protein [Azospirillum halopraeferens]|uniref:ShlB/FhaC/HecB family hemolysin secretion/activation protein n=1 Tax=Azospirillum halopraeferens TaxID=34010 RepID=UPI0004198933|nr:ShlB/FhaC/HecB family hemolysin secretion/activation protein [Azospirillum halopraeferens]
MTPPHARPPRCRAFRPSSSAALLLACALVVAAPPGAAQGIGVPAAPPAVRPGDVRPALPDFAAPPPFTLPPPPLPPPASDTPSSGASVLLRELRVVGNGVLPQETIRAAAAPYVGRRVGAAELEALRRALTALYVERGFVNSGFVLPDQRVVDGVVVMQAVEGRLTAVEVSGPERLDPGYVVRRLERTGGEPLDIAALRDGIAVLLRDPMIERLDARLEPGLRPGEGVLAVRVEETPLASGTVTLANDRTPATGATAARGDLLLRNLSGAGDRWWARAAATRGLTDVGLAADVPLAAAGTRLRVAVDHTDARVVEAPFSVLDLVSRTTTLEVGLSHPVHRTAVEDVSLDVTAARRRSSTWLLGERFGFSGSDGVVDVSVLRLGQTWTRRGTDTALAARSTLSLGLPVLGATRSAQGGDGRFVTWLGQVQFARRLTESGAQLILRADAQFADGPLPAIERFAVGGLSTVRGFRENLLVRDNALVGSAELRVPVARLAPGGSDADDGTVQVAAFVDVGRAFDRGGDSAGPDRLTGAGFGLLWSPTRHIGMTVYYGHGFERVQMPGRTDLQDRGIHFRLTVVPF